MSILRITLDVETIPTQNKKFIDAIDVACPGNYTKPESIEKWNLEKKPALIEKAYRDTALDSTKGELIVIGWAINDADPQCVFRRPGESEGDMLRAFYDLLTIHTEAGFYSEILWIGHCISTFDLPYIWHRSRINHVTSSVSIPYNVKPWSDAIFDTRHVWKAASNASSNLTDICTAIGIPCKQRMKGSEVWDYVQQGRIQEVADYCMYDDIVATRDLYHVLR
jgi:hypothetical protein